MKYPQEQFGLETALGPAIRLLERLQNDARYPASIARRLGYVGSLLVELVDDDLLGLIDATPEERVRLAIQIARAGDD